jgi:hypothetical protein
MIVSTEGAHNKKRDRNANETVSAFNFMTFSGFCFIREGEVEKFM